MNAQKLGELWPFYLWTANHIGPQMQVFSCNLSPLAYKQYQFRFMQALLLVFGFYAL